MQAGPQHGPNSVHHRTFSLTELQQDMVSDGGAASGTAKNYESLDYEEVENTGQACCLSSSFLACFSS